jgi:Domain of unknown function (DUF4338)
MKTSNHEPARADPSVAMAAQLSSPSFARRRSHLNKPIELYREEVRKVLEPRRLELIRAAEPWIRSHEDHLLEFFVKGSELDIDAIKPELEICRTQDQIDLWRYVRFLGTIPYSDYVGRRIRFLIRDGGQASRPVIGIAALGSTVLQCLPRDFAIGWNLPHDRPIKSERLIAVMDLFVSIAAPPYNELTAGKLICYMMLSNEVRRHYEDRYHDTKTRMSGRTNKHLVLINTTSLYGSSIQYNRLRFRGQLVYQPVGFTSGYGNSHVSEQEFQDMLDFLRSYGENHVPSYEWGAGASWRVRVIRAYWLLRAREARYHAWILTGQLPPSQEISAAHLAERMLHHQHLRQVYIAPLASNWREYLRGETDEPNYYDWPLEDLIQHWRENWMRRRLAGEAGVARLEQVIRPFEIEQVRLSHLL